MIFVSLIDMPKDSRDQWVFCIEVDEPLREHIRKCIEFFKSRSDLKECKFAIDTYRSRFLEREDYDEIIDFPPDPLCGEDALNYYEIMWDNGTPKQDYWEYIYDVPKEVQVWIIPNGVGFSFTDVKYKKYETRGMSWNDFLRDN